MLSGIAQQQIWFSSAGTYVENELARQPRIHSSEICAVL